MPKTAPAFQLYAADFYMDTGHWSVDEIGIYTRLLLSQWINKTLPDDPHRLARLAGCSSKKFLKGWSTISIKFQPLGNGQLQNIRLEEEREKQHNYANKQADRAKKRWSKPNAAALPAHVPEPCRNDAFQSSSSLNTLLGSNTTVKGTTEKPKETFLQNPETQEKKIPESGFTTEEISESSKLKIEADLIAIANQLSSSGKFSDAHNFIQVQRNFRLNPKAILHSLNRCLLAKPKNGTWDPWAYCKAILDIENGNYNERESISDHR